MAFGNDPRFIGVGAISTGGTGTYIGRGNGFGWVLTANHVIGTGETGSFYLPNLGTWSLNNTYRIPGTDVSISRLVNFNLDIYAPTLNTSSTLATGTDFISAGYGYNRSQSSNTYDEDSNRRGFQSKVAGFYTETNPNDLTFPGQYVVDRFDRPTDPNATAIEGFGAPGDSGSMVLTAQGIVGVLSYGDYEKYGGLNYYSRLTPAVSSAIYARTGITPVPEPATLAALGLGALAMLRRRKRA